ncbi:hypothetical protein HYALB_00010493 [Hymenoscyphus albidus]|uniref:Rrn9 domain-containing protein n=1 Tax=Hymenoscyphus albidus TaxID=595503 RepID=A0A9N9LVS0_9HELO|nr:hypothetical protein HYALB_00010493 [Hymenoscyphus albidus]
MSSDYQPDSSSDPEDSIYEGSDEEVKNSGADDEDEEEEEEETRPNRWTGHPSTWRGITELERGLAASLEAGRNADLGIHLYNAFALKRRARGLVEGLRRGEPSENPVDTDRDDPREKSSAVLEDVLVATSLRFAKERFDGREWGVEGEHDALEEEDDEDEESEESSEDNAEMVKEGNQTPETTYMKPIVSADDERSAELLRPSVRYSMEKLDAVLIALHHARETCRRHGSSTEDTDGEATTTVEKRPQGRPRNYEITNLVHRERQQEEASIEPELTGDFIRRKNSTKGTRRGRPPKQYPRLDGETEKEYIIRICKLQKKPLPAWARSRERAESLPKSPKKSVTPRNRACSVAAAEKHLTRLGLRDWREVLGTAALAGFPADAVARATQRCANLFGEGMVLRTLVETPFFGEGSIVDTTYQPDLVPNLDGEIHTSDSDGFQTTHSHSSQLSGTKCYTCPIKGCTKREKGFKSQSQLMGHLRTVHEMDAKDAAQFDVPSDDECEGAVHIDGFLRPVKRGWRGPDKGPRKKLKKALDSLTGSDVENSEEDREVEGETSE